MNVLTTLAISAPTTPPINPSSNPMGPSVRHVRPGVEGRHCAREPRARSSRAAMDALRAALHYYIITTTLKKSAPVVRAGAWIMRQVGTLGLLGTGVIGGGWAARALHFGVDVIAADVKPEMEAWIRGAVQNAEPALARLTFAPLPPKGKLSFTTDLRVMARQAD